MAGLNDSIKLSSDPYTYGASVLKHIQYTSAQTVNTIKALGESYSHGIVNTSISSAAYCLIIFSTLDCFLLEGLHLVLFFL